MRVLHGTFHSGLGDVNGLDPKRLRERIPMTEVFEQYVACQDCLTRKQWQVVCLHYKEGMSQCEIGEVLCKSRSAVSELLDRARARKEAVQKRLRAEQYELRRKYLEE